jgi:hypothetical protein
LCRHIVVIGELQCSISSFFQAMAMTLTNEYIRELHEVSGAHEQAWMRLV